MERLMLMEMLRPRFIDCKLNFLDFSMYKSQYIHVGRTQILVVLAGFLVTATTTSLVFSFGVYQDLYEAMAKEPNNPFTDISSSKIGLIGILSVSFMTMGGPFVAMWARLYPPQFVVATGGLVFGVAHILASFSERTVGVCAYPGSAYGCGHINDICHHDIRGADLVR
jgi:hypothetical protein